MKTLLLTAALFAALLFAPTNANAGCLPCGAVLRVAAAPVRVVARIQPVRRVASIRPARVAALPFRAVRAVGFIGACR